MGMERLRTTLVLTRCLSRIRRWAPPPNWSLSDWQDEARACGSLASCLAERDFDPKRGTPLEGFLYGRIMAAMLTRYRQEWSYACHCAARECNDEAFATTRANPHADAEPTHQFMNGLAEQDRWMLEQAFWHDRTEADIARQLGVSQQAVSKRKLALLRSLRVHLSV